MKYVEEVTDTGSADTVSASRFLLKAYGHVPGEKKGSDTYHGNIHTVWVVTLIILVFFVYVRQALAD